MSKPENWNRRGGEEKSLASTPKRMLTFQPVVRRKATYRIFVAGDYILKRIPRNQSVIEVRFMFE